MEQYHEDLLSPVSTIEASLRTCVEYTFKVWERKAISIFEYEDLLEALNLQLIKLRFQLQDLNTRKTEVVKAARAMKSVADELKRSYSDERLGDVSVLVDKIIGHAEELLTP